MNMKRAQRGPTNNQRDTARVEAFSDGVFAIAITLLVLNLRVPGGRSQENLWTLLWNQWSMFLGYITSFIVLGIIWLNHHHMFTYIHKTDRGLLIWNTFALMFVAFIPYPTALVAQYIGTENGKIAVVIYSATLLIVTILYNFLWWYATAGHRLVEQEIDTHVLRTITRSYLLGVPLYSLSLVVALINVEASLLMYIMIAILYLLFAGPLPTPSLPLLTKKRETERAEKR